MKNLYILIAGSENAEPYSTIIVCPESVNIADNIAFRGATHIAIYTTQKEALEALKTFRSNGENFYAVTRWMVEDVQQLRPGWTEEQCAAWWSEHEKAFRDLLTEYGNECLQNMIEQK